MTIGRVFKLAQDSLWDGVSHLKDWPPSKQKMICLAITNLLNRRLITRREHDAARRVIRSRIGSHIFLEDWLASKGVPTSQMTSANLQAHRLAWLKKLELEFSNESEG